MCVFEHTVEAVQEHFYHLYSYTSYKTSKYKPRRIRFCYPASNRTVGLFDAVGIKRFLALSRRSPEKRLITAVGGLTAKFSGFVRPFVNDDAFYQI